MSEKDFQDEKNEKVNHTLLDDSMQQGSQQAPPAVFHRVKCHECGEGDLSLFDFGVFLRSDFLGMTNEGEKGCGGIELDGDYEWVVMCGSCGHRVFDEPSCTKEQLLEWAIAEGQETETLTVSCPICGSTSLSEIRTEVEIVREVVAVYMIPGDGETERRTEIALVPDREIYHTAAPRYRCSNGHELAKDDGTPVETAEELVEWLKAHSAGDNG